MKLLVLANEELKRELMSVLPMNSIEIEWLEEPVSATAGQLQADACIDLLFELGEERIKWLKSLETPLVIVNSVVKSLAEIGHNFIRINGWSTFLNRPLTEMAAKDPVLQQNASVLFDLLGRKIEWVPDICGFVTPRIVAGIINEAFFSLEEEISSPDEIDIAMKLGTSYPYGPFEWGQKIGLHRVYELLSALCKEQERYRPSSLLKQTALA